MLGLHVTIDRSQRVTRRVIPIALGVVVAAVYVPAVVSVGLRTDLGAHVLHAQQLELSGKAIAPYYLLFQVMIIVRALIPFAALEAVIPAAGSRQATWDIAAVATVVGAAVLAAEVIYFRLLGATDVRRAGRDGWMRAAAALGLMLIGPITVFTWSNQQLVVGYITVTFFDAATTLILKPLALLLFWFVIDRVDAESTSTRDVWVCAALSVLAWSAKPSFTVCFVPALMVYLALRARRGRDVAWKLVGLGVVLPTVLVGGALTVGATNAAGPGDAPGFALDPLSTIGDQLAMQDQPVWMFAPFLVASCAFPMVVALTYRRRVAASSALVLAWMVFAVGVGQYYLLRITGKTDFGDLIGGAQIGLFLVYVESVRFAFVEERRVASDDQRTRGQRIRLRQVALPALFAFQVFCGVFLLVQDVVNPAAWW